ncbi:LysM peptidoglycan-binding domain-containing protein, partial [Allosphingosinicella sp.]|uniref:LysM peptidoglycan-binding domain-containing protein n=1 Tax=Allosphingosinicella sp. TaxID=2823234 RepID=UPI002F03FC78
MVAVITGTGVGLERSSGSVLGSNGQLGEARLGRFGDRVYVNGANGNLVLQNSDEVLIGRGADVNIARTYNSRGELSVDQTSWRQGDWRRVTGLTGTVNTAGSTVRRIARDGSDTLYTYNAAASHYITTDGAGAHDTLTVSGGVWTWTDGDTGLTEAYDNSQGGRLIYSTTREGHNLVYSYNADGTLSKIATAGLEETNFTYSLGKLTRVATTYKDTPTTTKTTTSVDYGYDGQGRLQYVFVELTPENSADNSLFQTTYAYHGTSERIASVLHSDGSRVDVTYTQVGAAFLVSKIDQTDGSGTTRATTFAYNTGIGLAYDINHDGYTTSINCNEKGELTKIYRWDTGQITEFTYTASGDVATVKNANENVTTYDYDGNGNRTFERDALGNTIKRRFDAANVLLAETRYLTPDPDGGGGALPDAPVTTRFVYRDDKLLQFAVSGEGRVTEYGYNGYKQRDKEIQYLGQKYPVTSLTPDQDITVASLESWRNSTADRSSTQLVETLYDFRGNVAQVTTYGAVSTGGVGDGATASSVHYIYDQSGNLLSRKFNNSLATETFLYDGIGRLIKTTDAASNETTIVHNDGSNSVAVALANGSTKTSVYNLAGELITETHSAGAAQASKTYKYDKLGRLRIVQDENGAAGGLKTYYLYDKGDRRVAEIAHDGSLTEFAYDRNNQIVRTIHRANKLAADKLALLVDANGNPTSATTVTLESVRPAGHADDRYEWRVYDASNRLVQTIDGAGATSILAYDGASRLVSTTAYATAFGAVAVSGFKNTVPAALVTPAGIDSERDRVERNFYDKDGLLLGTLDGEGGFVEHRYDHGGRQIRTIRYEKEASSSLRASGTFAQILADVTAQSDVEKNINEYSVYDGRGQLRATIDGEGNLTRYRYTAHGYVDQQIRGQKLDPAPLRTTAPTLANLPAAATGTVLETIAFSHDHYGRVLTETRLLEGDFGEVTTHVYDKLGNLTKSTTTPVAAGQAARIAHRRYDGVGRLIGELSAEGSDALAALGQNPTEAAIDTVYRTWGTTYQYDNASRLISKTEPNGTSAAANRTIYYYESNDLLTYEINAAGEVVEYLYNAMGELIDRVTLGARLAPPYVAYLLGGQVTPQVNTDIATARTTNDDIHSLVAYDVTGRVKQTTNGAGDSVTFTYNSFGELDKRTDPLSGTTTVETVRTYDRRGLLKSETRDPGAGALALATTFGYDAFGRATHVTDAGNRVRETRYDRAGRTVTTIDAAGGTQTFTYDGRGNVKTVTDRANNTTIYEYDRFSRTITVKTPELIVTTMVKNAYGETISITDGEGRATTYAYDRNGNLKSVTNAAGTVDNNYDNAGRLIETFDILEKKTAYSYDAAGRVLSRTVDAGGLNLLTSYSYDARGQQITVVDPTLSTTKTEYDKAGRVKTTIVDQNGLNLTTVHDYDKSGRLLKVTQGSGTATATTTEYLYDKAGRLLRSTVDPTGLNLATQYAYDKNGNAVSVTDGSNRVTRYVYDAENRLTYAIDGELGVTRTFYDGEGRVTATRTHATPGSTSIRTDSDLTMADMATYAPISTTDQLTSYVYDKDGRLRFTIDAHGRPTEYVYDKSGNVLRSIDYAGTITVVPSYTTGYVEGEIAAKALAGLADTRSSRSVYDSANRQAYGIDAAGGVTHYGYDGNGNVVKQTSYATLYTAAGTPTLQAMNDWAAASANQTTSDRLVRNVYDGAGRQAFSVDARGAVVAYRYDSNGNAVAQVRYATLYTAAGDPTLADLNSWAAANPAADDRVSRSVYDTAGRPTFSIDSEGAVAVVRYDATGNAVKQIRYAARYTSAGDPTIAQMNDWAALNSGANDRTSRTLYDGASRAAYEIDAENYVSELRYDSAGRVTKQIRYSGAHSFDDSSTLANVASAVAGDQNVTLEFGYDAAGRLVDSWDGESVRTHVILDSFGRATHTIAAYGTADESTTFRQFDKLGRVEIEKQAFGADGESTSVFTYDGVGRLKTVKDGRLNTTSFDYDRMGRVVKETVPLADGVDAVTFKEYDSFGNITKVIDPRENSGRFYYDKAGRLTLQIDPELYATKTEYSLGNEAVKVTRYDKKVTFDAVTGAPVIVDPSLASITTMVRDKLDRLISVTDAVNFIEKYELDAFGDRKKVTNKLNGVTDNLFDKRGLLLSETRSMALGRADGTTATLNVVTGFAYDSRGNLATKTEAAGLAEQRITQYRYDKGDRLVETEHQPVEVTNQVTLLASTVTPIETVKYDKRGNVVESKDPGGARTLSYWDDSNRKVAELNAAGTLTRFTYDANGNVLTQRVYGDPVALPALAGGTPPAPVDANNYRETEFSYDKNDRLRLTIVRGLRVGEGASYSTSIADVVTERSYDKAGNLVEEKDGRGNSHFYYYDKAGRKTAEIDREKYLTTYELDSEGNVTKEVRFGLQLTAAVTAESVLSTLTPALDINRDRITDFTYDRNGRRLTETRYYVYGKAVGSTGAISAAGTHAQVKHWYNGLGEVTVKQEATGEQFQYSYDVHGRQTSAQGATFADFEGATVRQRTEFAYDGLGNVVRSTEKGKTTADDRTTLYAYGTGGRLASVTDATNFTRSYGHDAAGRTVKEEYSRLKSDGTSVTEASNTRYDVLGRVSHQSVATYAGFAWSFGDVTNLTYNSYGEVAAKGLNGMAQEKFEYDKGGRLWRSNSGDGSVRMFVYDKAGNRTLTVGYSGVATLRELATTTLDVVISDLTAGGTAAIGAVDVADLVATIEVFDKRGQATETREPFRQIVSGTARETIVRSRAYNAFGEVKSETDARGYTTNFTYNMAGRLTKTERPTTSYTNESGTIVANVRPTEEYYYDLSGRTVGVKDANGNITSRTLLTGTGYGGAEAKVLIEYRADGGKQQQGYDAHGDVRTSKDGIDRITSYSYDKAGRLTQLSRPGGLLTEHYAYDGLGQRTQQWNSHLGSGVKNLTDYDSQGRVVKTVEAAGHADAATTTYSYAWSNSLVTTGLGTFGGWTKTTTHVSTKAATESLDYFGRQVDKTDLGLRNYDFTFDKAGRLIQQTNSAGQSIGYTYFNTGKIASIGDARTNHVGDPMSIASTFAYDKAGNRVFEGYTSTTTKYDWEGMPYEVTKTHQWANVEYDELGRMKSFIDAGINGSNPATVKWEYDLAGNIRRLETTHKQLSYDYTVSDGMVTNVHWYRYDSMNRFVVTKGYLAARGSGTIAAGTAGGLEIGYDQAGQRRTVTTRTVSGSNINHRRESYSYTTDGHLDDVTVATAVEAGGTLGSWSAEATIATNDRDAMGRVTSHSEYSGGVSVYSRTVQYNARSEVTSESTSTKQSDGATLTATTTYDYRELNGAAWTGAYLGGAVTHSYTTSARNGTAQPVQETTNSYTWWDDARISVITNKPNPTTTWTSTHSYDSNGRIARVVIDDDRDRTVSFITDHSGQVMSRSEGSNAPWEIYYYFNGMRIGDVGNNGPSQTDYATAITARSAAPQTGAFKTGSPVNYADFDQSFDPINPTSQGNVAGSYTVRDGDTIRSIAAMIWGDASMWYLLADANGLNGSETLVAGQSLIVPAKITNIHNDSETFRVYDPNRAIGDNSPTQVGPNRGNACGAIGKIVLVAVAIGVGAFLGPHIGFAVGQLGLGATAGGIVAAGLTGAAASAISQGVGVAMGIQPRIDWKGVGLAAITAGLAQGADKFLGIGKIAGSAALGDAARGAAVNAASQGVGVALKLQDKFDWAGVASAAVVAGTVGWVSGKLPGWAQASAENAKLARFLNRNISGAAATLAGASARSLITGTSFGDNIMRVLPDVIGSTIGNGIAEQLKSRPPEPNPELGDFPNRPVQYARVWVPDMPGTSAIRSDAMDPPAFDMEEVITVIGRNWWSRLLTNFLTHSGQMLSHNRPLPSMQFGQAQWARPSNMLTSGNGSYRIPWLNNLNQRDMSGFGRFFGPNGATHRQNSFGGVPASRLQGVAVARFEPGLIERAGNSFVGAATGTVELGRDLVVGVGG